MPLLGSKVPESAVCFGALRGNGSDCVCRILHHQGKESGHRGITTDISEAVYTHIPGPPVSQNVINRPKQQVLSVCPLLTTNYKALQVCPANHTCNEKSIQYQSLLPLCFNLCSFFNSGFLLLEACVFSHTHMHRKLHGNVIRSASSCGYSSVY